MTSKIVRSEALSMASRDQRSANHGKHAPARDQETASAARKKHQKSASKNRRASKKDLTDATPPAELGDNLNA